MKFSESVNAGGGFSLQQANQLFRDMNRIIFNNEISAPWIIFESNLNHLVPPQFADLTKDGDVLGFCDLDPDTKKCVILLNAKIRRADTFMEVLAHEMVHQHLAETTSYQDMLRAGHGPTFMAYTSKVRQYRGLILRGATFEAEL